MERTAINDLPKGTLNKLKKVALQDGFKKLNGNPNVTAMLREMCVKKASEAK